MNSAIIENLFVERLTAPFVRSPMQTNRLHESDSELIRLKRGDGLLLAVTTDSIAEEISLGLYDDPYLIGWMAVMVNMSDLAAVGASPVGILVSEVLPPDYPHDSLRRLQQGIADACAACSTFVLGGDTNSGDDLLLTGCAIGTLESGNPITRVGAREGDILYATGMVGAGNGFALGQYLKMRQHSIPSYMFQPSARLVEGQTIAGIASSCMDTSDGVLATLDQLMRINHAGFELDRGYESLIHPDARLIAEEAGIPSWLLLAGHHGEFELLFTVPPAKEQLLKSMASEAGWRPLCLGRVIAEERINLHLYGRPTDLDTCTIRNLAASCANDIEQYIQELCSIDNQLKKGASYHVNA